MSQMHNEIWHGTKALILICSDTWSDEDDLLTLTDKWDKHRERDTRRIKKANKLQRKGQYLQVGRLLVVVGGGVRRQSNRYPRVNQAIGIVGPWGVTAALITLISCSRFLCVKEQIPPGSDSVLRPMSATVSSHVLVNTCKDVDVFWTSNPGKINENYQLPNTFSPQKHTQESAWKAKISVAQKLPKRWSNGLF